MVTRLTSCRRWLAAVGIALAATAVPGLAEDTAAEISALRQLLGELEARLAVLEAGDDAARAQEIADVRQLLATAAERIAALESTPPPRTELPAAEPAPAEETIAGLLVRDLYGSLRVRSLVAEGGDVEFIDRFSRIGVYLAYPGGRSWSVLGRFEAGLNLVNQNPTIDVGGDPGYAYGEGGEAVTTRLGYVGFTTSHGQFTWGKQWGVYYDVAGWTDQFYTFGGDAAGAYSMGDGGITGTGRAETALQYRDSWGPLQLGLQVQNRKRTANDRNYADTFGGSLRFTTGNSLTLGLAYNEVRDGVEDPRLNEPHLGDTALVVGARWQRGRLLAAATFARGEQRERDDSGTWIDSLGGELFAEWTLDDHWSAFGGLNWLEPDDETVASEYRILDFLFGAAYRLNPYVVISGETRLADSRTAAGERLRADTFAFGVNIGW